MYFQEIVAMHRIGDSHKWSLKQEVLNGFGSYKTKGFFR